MRNKRSGVGWIVDGAYANLGARNHGLSLDYVELRRFLEREILDSAIDESYFINAVSGSIPESVGRFYKFIQSAFPIGPQMNLELHGLKRRTHECSGCKRRCEQMVQKGVDVAIATRMIDVAQRCNSVVLLLGDSDFVESIRYIKNRAGCRIIVAGFRGSLSPEIQCLANKVIWLDDQTFNVSRKVVA